MDGGMDGRNGGMLLKIAALLVSLSLVAERAAGRSLPMRFLVLAILRRSEAVATSFVAAAAEAAGATADDFPWLDEAPEDGASPLDAAWLALRFRLLAALLELCRAAGRSHDATGSRAGNWAGNISGKRGCTRAPHPALSILLLVLPATRGLPVYDTS
ncbi:MAG: hypothetical protein F9K19_11070 [Rhizobiaceae bacterium]|nr:MAG: hypothetical protein F9K19_11070 [Rhizobiaceae bacterium]CAG0967800.1 hypothetical protein RHIZO_01057 [Rhizobiaceae bacterium]